MSLMRLTCLPVLLIPGWFCSVEATAESCRTSANPPSVRIDQTASGTFELRVDGKPFVARGVGGHRNLDILREAGGNTLRTWGIDDLERKINGKPFLDYALENGFRVLAGIWIQHERHGFDYRDPKQVEEQRRTVREAVRKYRDHPAILMWGVGNEVEAFRGDDDDTHIWKELNALAAIVKETDPNRPVMTALAGVTAEKVAKAMRYCPDIDVLGVNAYAAAIRTGEILNEAGWDRPFMLTEFGPRGHWEVPETDWGAPIEPTGDAKARYYLETYRTVMEDAGDRCLGTFAFLWGHKQEVTHTWYGMFLPTGEKLPSVDTMSLAWSGKYPEFRCPSLEAVDFDGAGKVVKPGTTWTLTATASDPAGLSLNYSWEVFSEQTAPSVGGDREIPPERHPDAVIEITGNQAIVRAPQSPGAYRIFLTVRNTENSATTANFPFKVRL